MGHARWAAGPRGPSHGRPGAGGLGSPGRRRAGHTPCPGGGGDGPREEAAPGPPPHPEPRRRRTGQPRGAARGASGAGGTVAAGGFCVSVSRVPETEIGRQSRPAPASPALSSAAARLASSASFPGAGVRPRGRSASSLLNKKRRVRRRRTTPRGRRLEAVGGGRQPIRPAPPGRRGPRRRGRRGPGARGRRDNESLRFRAFGPALTRGS